MHKICENKNENENEETQCSSFVYGNKSTIFLVQFVFIINSHHPHLLGVVANVRVVSFVCYLKI